MATPVKITSPEVWRIAKHTYENEPITKYELRKRYRLHANELDEKIYQQGWKEYRAEKQIQALIPEKLANITQDMSESERALALDHEANRRAIVEVRQRGDTDALRQLVGKVANKFLALENPPLKDIKILAETVQIIHNIERKCYRLDDGAQEANEREDRKWIIELVRPQQQIG